MPPRTAHRSPPTEDTRTRILEVATELFVDQGFERTSLQQIADRIGVTKAALYYHFKSKDELLRALLAPSIEEFDELLDRYENMPNTAARVRAFVDAYVDQQLAHRRMVAFISRDRTILKHPAIASRTQPTAQRLERLLVGDDLDFGDQIRVAIAVGGVSAAVIRHGGHGDQEQLRRELGDAVAALLRHRNKRSRNTS